MKTRIVHVKKEKYDVYIGRSGAVVEPGMITQKVTYGYFGNPFRIGKDGTRDEVIAKYKVWFYGQLKTDPEFKQRIEALRGKTLGCFCAPEACHGDVIIEYLEAEPSYEIEEELPATDGAGNPATIKICKNTTKDGEFCPRCDMAHSGPCLDKNVHDIRVGRRRVE